MKETDEWKSGGSVALAYLRRLHDSGYFLRQHTFCDGIWFQDEPACADEWTWNSVKRFLLENGYVTVEHLSNLESSALNLHPKDELDTWWFKITAKGLAWIADPTQA